MSPLQLTAIVLLVLAGLGLAVLSHLANLIRQGQAGLRLHGAGLAAHLDSLERRPRVPIDRRSAARDESTKFGRPGRPATEGSVRFQAVVPPRGPAFEIAIDLARLDPIVRAVASGTLWFLDDYEVLLDQLQPGHRVLDLGAHIGTFALAAAARGCEVIAVEAAPDNVRLLRASVARNGFDRLLVIQAAVTDRAGQLEFLPNGPWGTISNPATVGAPSLIYASAHAPVTVPALTVDALLEQVGWGGVDFLKLDVEGSELAAIRGMARLLAGSPGPTLLYESNGQMLHCFGGTPGQLLATLAGCGYRSYALDHHELVPAAAGELQARCVLNYFATKGPPSRLVRWPIGAPRTPERLIQDIVTASQVDDPFPRAYLGRALAGASAELLADDQVTAVLLALSADSVEAVRAATAWFGPPGAG